MKREIKRAVYSRRIQSYIEESIDENGNVILTLGVRPNANCEMDIAMFNEAIDIASSANTFCEAILQMANKGIISLPGCVADITPPIRTMPCHVIVGSETHYYWFANAWMDNPKGEYCSADEANKPMVFESAWQANDWIWEKRQAGIIKPSQSTYMIGC
jgi:hypothetical protein